MVSWVGAGLAISLGVLVYVALPMGAMALPVELRKKVGEFYLKLAARCLKQFAFVRRILSGYDVIPIKVDDEQKLLKVTLSNSLAGDSNAYPFKDPDNRVLRLYNKPVSLNYEGVPGALDAELAELGHWVGEKDTEGGLWSGDLYNTDVPVTVDPFVEMDDGLRLVDPIDAYNLVPNDVDPENVKTTEQLTKKRFEKYNPGVNTEQMISGALGFALGLGGILVMNYAQHEIIGGGGGPPQGPSIPVGALDVQPLLDVVVMFL